MAVKDTVRLQPFLRSSADNFDWAGRPHIQTFAVTGPFNADGTGDTPSRREIFTCRPTSSRRERDCATQILEPPRSPRVSAAGLEGGARADPRLLRRGAQEGHVRERHPARPRAHPRESALRLPRRARSRFSHARARRIASRDVELASRLSFFLWSSIPDDDAAAMSRAVGA